MTMVAGSGMNGINGVDIANLDIETALMVVQSTRSNLLEQSLRQQLDTVQARNNQMADLNNTLSAKSAENVKLQADTVAMTEKIAELKDLQGRLAASKCPDPEGWYGLSWGQGDDKALSHATLDQAKAAGLTIPTGADAPRDIDGNGTMDAKGKVVQGWVDQLGGKIADLESQLQQTEQKIKTNEVDITSIKGQIDAVGNSQQMEMLRLQGLTNKRNEAFDLMTNFMKKQSDSKSSIIGNMR
jgi:TolA-binding protein